MKLGPFKEGWIYDLSFIQNLRECLLLFKLVVPIYKKSKNEYPID